MDINRIKNLLEKYFEGLTSLEEEQELLEYFSDGNEVPVELISYKKHFRFLDAGRNLNPATSGFETRIARLIDDQDKTIKPVSNRQPIYKYAIAASVAVLIGFAGMFIYQNQFHRSKDTFSDPQLAYIEAQKTILFVSQKMNKGIQPLSNINKINEATDNLKSLDKLDNSLEMLNLFSILNNSSNLKK
jgi:hypothetical protein